MKRREFIIRLIGIDLKSLFQLAGIVFAAIIFLSVDFSHISYTFISVAKLLGFFLLITLLLIVVLVFINVIFQKLFTFLPQNLVSWFRRYGSIIVSVLYTLLLLYLIYDSIKEERYFILFFALVYFVLSYLFKSKKQHIKE
jgi:hypothetical protein